MESHAVDPETTVYVDTDDDVVGSRGRFNPVYADEAASHRWGSYCRACGTVDTAMDTMGRIVCNACSNTRQPEAWDAVRG